MHVGNAKEAAKQRANARLNILVERKNVGGAKYACVGSKGTRNLLAFAKMVAFVCRWSQRIPRSKLTRLLHMFMHKIKQIRKQQEKQLEQWELP